MKWSEVDISLNHDIMASFLLHKVSCSPNLVGQDGSRMVRMSTHPMKRLGSCMVRMSTHPVRRLGTDRLTIIGKSPYVQVVVLVLRE